MNKKIFNWMMVVALMATPMVLTSCGDDDDDEGDNGGKDDDPKTEYVTIGFENQQVNGEGFWRGTTDGQKYGPYDDGNGGTVTTYVNTYKEGAATFTTNYSIWGSMDYWSGFAISQRTEKTFDSMTRMPDEYNNIVGKANSGKSFAVVYSYDEYVEFDKPVKLTDMAYTNSAYTVNTIVNGDPYAKKFDENDFLTCTVTGLRADTTVVASVDIDLASKGQYVDSWKTVDLSKLKNVKFITFSFKGTDTNDYGLNTPAYICIDDLRYEKE